MRDCVAPRLCHVSFSRRFRGNSGHQAESAKMSKMTQSDTSPAPIAALRKVHLALMMQAQSAPSRRSNFDSNRRRMYGPERLAADFVEAGLPHPGLAFRAGVLKAAGRFDQHVEARK